MNVLFTLVFVSSLETAAAAVIIKITEKLFVRNAGLRIRSAALTFLLCFQPAVILFTLICRLIKANKAVRGNTVIVKVNLLGTEKITFTEPSDIIRKYEFGSLIAYIWLFIAMLFLLWNLIKYLRFRLLLERNFLRRISNNVSELRVISNSIVKSPFLMGIFESVIVLPEIPLSENELSMIIHHETIHKRRHDILRKISAVFLKCINWFNPVFYFFEYKIGEVSELIADEIFTTDMTHSEKKEYGNMLLRFAENQSVHTNTYLSGNAVKLAKRLELIMKMKHLSNKKIHKAVIVPVAVIAIAVIGIGTAAAVKAMPDKRIIDTPAAVKDLPDNNTADIPPGQPYTIDERFVIENNNAVPQDPVSGFSEIRDIGTKLPADMLKPEADLQMLANNMYAVEAEQSDGKYQAGKIAYGNAQVIVLCETGDRGFSFEEGQNGIIEIVADFSPWYSADGSTGERLEVGYICDGVSESLYSGKIYDEGLSVSFTADKAGEYQFYITNCSAGLQNYSYISVEKQ